MSSHEMFMQTVARDTMRVRQQEAAAHRLAASTKAQRTASRPVGLMKWLGRTAGAIVQFGRLKQRLGEARS